MHYTILNSIKPVLIMPVDDIAEHQIEYYQGLDCFGHVFLTPKGCLVIHSSLAFMTDVHPIGYRMSASAGYSNRGDATGFSKRCQSEFLNMSLDRQSVPRKSAVASLAESRG